MEIYTPGKAGNEVIETLKKKVKRIDDSREEFNRQALVNVMFLYGKHHFTLTKTAGSDTSLGQRILWELESAKKSNTMRRTSNYILPLFRSVYSRMIRQKASVHAEPTTSTEKDRNAARVSKECAEEFWQNCNRNNPWISTDFTGMQAVMMRLILYKMTVGMGYLIPYYNPKAKTFLYDQASQNVFEADVGEAEVRPAMPLNIFRDRFNRFIIERRFISPEQVEYETGQQVDPCEMDEETPEARISRLLDGTSKEQNEHKDGVYVYTQWETPTTQEPGGRVWICTDKEVLFDGQLPTECRGRIPVFEFRYQDLGFSANAQGAIEQVTDLQQDYNFTLTRIAQHKKLMTGKVMAPHLAKMKVAWDDEVGQIIRYAQGQKPSYEQAVSVPAYFYEELRRIREDMENLMNSHDVSMGRTPGQVKSGIGIENLTERDDAQIAPELIMFEQKLGFFTENVLDIMQERYNERRLLSISGEDLAFEVKSFIGSDLFGQKRVQIRMGSNFPLDKTARTNYILMLKKEGFISPERAKELMEFTDIDGAFKSLDETAAKQDILNVIEGQMVVLAEPWEDHTIHLKVINDFRKGSMYAKLPEQTRMALQALADQHQQYLLAEQKAAAQMGAPLQSAQPQVPQGA